MNISSLQIEVIRYIHGYECLKKLFFVIKLKREILIIFLHVFEIIKIANLNNSYIIKEYSVIKFVI